MDNISQYAYPHLVEGEQDYLWCHRYAHDVVTGKIIAGKWIRKACERHLRDLERDDVYFDVQEAKNVVNWFKFIPITDGKHVGMPTQLLPWQIFMCCCLMAWKIKSSGLRKYKYAYVQVGRKAGKALALDTPILTPDGYKAMGNLSVGDFVFGADGKPTKIINESEIFTDHDCYEITFSNGEKITADADHLWKTTARVNKPNSGNNKGYNTVKGESSKTRARTTKELFDTQRYGIRNDTNHSIDITKPVEFTEKDLPLDPYILGVWLGDGASASLRITVSDEDLPHLITQIGQCGYFAGNPKKTNTANNVNLYCKSVLQSEMDVLGRYKNPLRQLFRGLNLLGNKHIPEIFMQGSVEQRLSLLQGLMDTDGTVCKRGKMEFIQKNKELSYQVYELICSLGIKASIKARNVKCNGKDAGIAYKILFSCNRSEMPVFRLPRKLERMVNGNASGIKQRSKTVQIVEVKKVDSVPTKCIQVDNESKLFLCGKTNIPTHNSTLAGGLTLYIMHTSGYFRPRAYSVATKKDQAKILWSAALVMIKISPELQSIFKPRANDILIPTIEGEFKPLASDSNSLDGLNPLVATLDECHAIKDRNLYGVMVSAFGAQEEGVMLTITTAGTVLDGICTDLNKAGKKVLGGERDQDAYFYLIYEIDKDDDWEEEENWYKANPALGYQPKIEYLRDRYVEATLSSEEKANFMTKHLNVFVSGADKWLDMDEVKKCRKIINIEEYYGRECTVGFDRSLVNDITSFCLLFPNELGGADCFYINLLPMQAVKDATDYLRSVYNNAIQNKNLEVLEGKVIQNRQLRKYFMWIHENFDVDMYGYDPYKMRETAMDMEEAGLPMVSVSQGVGNMSEPTKKLEELIKNETFRYDDDLLEFSCTNAILGVTKMNNVSVYRENVQTEKIDPLIATVIALSCATLREADYNPYEERGLL